MILKKHFFLWSIVPEIKSTIHVFISLFNGPGRYPRKYSFSLIGTYRNIRVFWAQNSAYVEYSLVIISYTKKILFLLYAHVVKALFSCYFVTRTISFKGSCFWWHGVFARTWYPKIYSFFIIRKSVKIKSQYRIKIVFQHTYINKISVLKPIINIRKAYFFNLE